MKKSILTKITAILFIIAASAPAIACERNSNNFSFNKFNSADTEMLSDSMKAKFAAQLEEASF